MTSTDNNDNIKIINDTAKVPEGIGIAEDSGFASITGSVTAETQGNVFLYNEFFYLSIHCIFI